MKCIYYICHYGFGFHPSRNDLVEPGSPKWAIRVTLAPLCFKIERALRSPFNLSRQVEKFLSLLGKWLKYIIYVAVVDKIVQIFQIFQPNLPDFKVGKFLSLLGKWLKYIIYVAVVFQMHESRAPWKDYREWRAGLRCMAAQSFHPILFLISKARRALINPSP